MKYSPSTNAFYDPAFVDAYSAAGNWPSDLVDVPPETFAQFSGPSPQGKALGAVNGSPAWVDALRFETADRANRAVVRAIDNATRQITGEVAADEKASWTVKAQAASAHIDGTATPEQTAMIAAEAQQTGETVDDLALLISERAAAYTMAIAPLTGIRRRATADIAAAQAGEYDAIVAAALDDIDAVLASLMQN